MARAMLSFLGMKPASRSRRNLWAIVAVIAAAGCHKSYGCDATQMFGSDPESPPQPAPVTVTYATVAAPPPLPPPPVILASMPPTEDADAGMSIANAAAPAESASQGPGYNVIYRDYGPNPAAAENATAASPPLPSSTSGVASADAAPDPSQQPEMGGPVVDLILTPREGEREQGNSKAEAPRTPSEGVPTNPEPVYEFGPMPQRNGLPLRVGH